MSRIPRIRVRDAIIAAILVAYIVLVSMGGFNSVFRGSNSNAPLNAPGTVTALGGAIPSIDYTVGVKDGNLTPKPPVDVWGEDPVTVITGLNIQWSDIDGSTSANSIG